jgi:hypothetical protein
MSPEDYARARGQVIRSIDGVARRRLVKPSIYGYVTPRRVREAEGAERTRAAELAEQLSTGQMPPEFDMRQLSRREFRFLSDAMLDRMRR